MARMDNSQIDDLVLRVYQRRLNDDCPGGADRMLKAAGEARMRRYANNWRGLVIATLIELGLHEDGRGPKASSFEAAINAVTPRASGVAE